MRKRKKIISVVGARPNFMKVAAIHRALKKYDTEIQHMICHTGQHYDGKMSKAFFDDLELPQPDFYLGVGSATHAQQTAKIMVAFEQVIEQERPDLVIVVGDVNSTLACSLVAAKMMIRIAHVEAGLRSFDRSMPEEINRVVVDTLADYLFVTERSAIDNLKKEGMSEAKIFFVGNVMIDSLVNYLPKAIQSRSMERFGLRPSSFILATFHRPSNVDTQEGLGNIVKLLNELADHQPVVFPVHPRTNAKIASNGFQKSFKENVIITEPLPYLDFLCLMRNASLVATDSGGIQEETTFMRIPCITIRENTERPVTVEEGTNYLAGRNPTLVAEIANQVLSGKAKIGRIPKLWDGMAGERIAEILHVSLTSTLSDTRGANRFTRVSQ
ncbi:MAG: UDP-N-acetyl glucosamine 2-epimerase [Bacteroidia bacterium]|nr:MAG: UDP-N-acetyl glucosamine 2-epimerase [Bacteroidia bacterium]